MVAKALRAREEVKNMERSLSNEKTSFSSGYN